MGYWGNPGIGPQDLRENTVDKHIKNVFFPAWTSMKAA